MQVNQTLISVYSIFISVSLANLRIAIHVECNMVHYECVCVCMCVCVCVCVYIG